MVDEKNENQRNRMGLYLEEKRPVAVDSFFDESNGNDIGLKLRLELTDMQHPCEFMKFFPLHFSAHGFTHQPGTINTFLVSF